MWCGAGPSHSYLGPNLKPSYPTSVGDVAMPMWHQARTPMWGFVWGDILSEHPTPKPKGVRIPRGNVAHFFVWGLAKITVHESPTLLIIRVSHCGINIGELFKPGQGLCGVGQAPPTATLAPTLNPHTLHQWGMWLCQSGTKPKPMWGFVWGDTLSEHPNPTPKGVGPPRGNAAHFFSLGFS